MTDDDAPQNNGSRFALLERITATVLLFVVASLVWIMLAAYVPDIAATVDTRTQIAVILALLSAALVLVSVVALLHTRNKR